MFQQLSRLNPDAILGLMAKFRADPFAQKVDLGVGVFRDLSGNTPILDCVRRAEQTVLKSQTTKSYVGAAGREEFNRAVEELVLGDSHAARRDRRVRTVQAPGGCGALRVGAELIRAAAPSAAVYVSDPTWGNHVPLLGSSGLRLRTLPLLRCGRATNCASTRCWSVWIGLRRATWFWCTPAATIRRAPILAPDQWQALIELLGRRRLIPFLDLAYQGFGENLDRGCRRRALVAESVPEVLIATSYSKNLGLYRERVGALIVVSENESRADAVHSHVLQIARSIYSMPPDHGAAIAACIFADSQPA